MGYKPFIGDGWCERVINWHVKPDTTLVNCMGGAVMVISLVAMLYKMGRSYRSSYRQTNVLNLKYSEADEAVVPLYFSFAQGAAVFLMVQAFLLILPASSAVAVYGGHVTYVLHSLLDNFLLVFLMHKKPDARAAERAMWVGTLLAVTKGVILLTMGWDALAHPWCSMFFPIAEFFWGDVIFSVVYVGIAIATFMPHWFPRHVCWKAPGRPALRTWLGYLTIVYLSVTVGCVLMLEEQDAGHCVVAGAVGVYCGCFAYLLYKSALRDSSYHHTQRAFEPLLVVGTDGKTQSTSDRLSALVKRVFSDRATSLIDFDELRLRARIGVGAYGEVFKATWRGTDVAVKRLRPDVAGLPSSTHRSPSSGGGARGGSDGASDATPNSLVSTGALEEFCQEVRVMQTLRHPNLLMLLGVSMSRNGSLCLITEYCAKGSLWDILRAIEAQKGTGGVRPRLAGRGTAVVTPSDRSLSAVSDRSGGRSDSDDDDDERERERDGPGAPLLGGRDASASAYGATGAPAVSTASAAAASSTASIAYDGGYGDERDTEKLDPPFSDRRTLSILRQAALGIAYLHGCKPSIIHRDLKSQNLLVDAHWQVKVADFGLSKELFDSEAHTRIGSVQWSAPEVILGKPYTIKADVWSFGVLCWEALVGQVPYKNLTAVQVAMQVAYEGLRLRVPGEPDLLAPAAGSAATASAAARSRRTRQRGTDGDSLDASGVSGDADSGDRHSGSERRSTASGGGGDGGTADDSVATSTTAEGAGSGARAGSGAGSARGSGSGGGGSTSGDHDGASSTTHSHTDSSNGTFAGLPSVGPVSVASAGDGAAIGGASAVPLKDSLVELMHSCWSLDPANRPSFRTIVKRLDALGGGALS